ncbi:MAG: hypothetical protein MI919_04190 [Holophagales bacterium]|nr:hypothetical protein [Holophagales bacterium]
MSGPLDTLRELLRQADVLRYRHPTLALRRALSLRDLAASFEEPRDSPDVWRLAQHEAWSVLASAYRCVGDLARAQSALRVALGFLEMLAATARPTPEEERRVQLAFARLARRASYLCCDQGRYARALELNDDAARGFDLASEPQLCTSTLVDRAFILHRAGKTRQAVPLLIRCLENLDRELEPRAYRTAIHNLAYYLLSCGRGEREELEALGWASLAIRQHPRRPEELGLLKLEALTALAALRLGRADEGTRILRRAYAGFVRLGAAAEQALTLLHLAGRAEESGDAREYRQLAARLAPLLRRMAPGNPRCGAKRNSEALAPEPVPVLDESAG